MCKTIGDWFVNANNRFTLYCKYTTLRILHCLPQFTRDFWSILPRKFYSLSYCQNLHTVPRKSVFFFLSHPVVFWLKVKQCICASCSLLVKNTPVRTQQCWFLWLMFICQEVHSVCGHTSMDGSFVGCHCSICATLCTSTCLDLKTKWVIDVDYHFC